VIVASGMRNPADLAFHPDTGGTIWRIAYKGTPEATAGAPADKMKR
jgi:hypothetical protein